MKSKREKSGKFGYKSAILVICAILCLLSAVECEPRRSSSRRTSKTSNSGRTYANSNRNNQQAQQNAQAPKKANVAQSSAAVPAQTAPKLNSPAQQSPSAPANPNPNNIGWNVNGNQNKPVGPPPAYPGMGHNYAPANGAPPAYSPYQNKPPNYYQSGYPGGVNHQYNQAGMDSSRHYNLQNQNPYNNHQYPSHNPYMNQGGYGGYNNMGGGMMNPGMMGGGMMNPGMMGGGMMGGGMMGGGMYGGGGYYPQKKSSIFSLQNVLTGVALYGMYRSLTGGFGGGGYGGYGHNYGYGSGVREVHIYDHRDKDKVVTNNDDLKPILGTVGMPQSITGQNVTMETKTIEEVAQNITNSNVTVSGDTELPPLPFDTMPKIYFGYGYAFGYENATVDLLFSNGTTAPITKLPLPKSDVTTTLRISTESDFSDITTEDTISTSTTEIVM